MGSDGVRIDSDLSKLVPDPTADELALLEASLLAHGCLDALISWKPHRLLLDGHTRLRLCRKHGISFKVRSISLPSREAAVAWIVNHQLGRRNLTAFQRAELALKLKPGLESEAAKRQEASRAKPGEKVGEPEAAQGGGKKNTALNIGVSGDSGKTVEKLATAAKVSTATMRKAEKLAAEAPEAVKESLRKGETTIHKAHKDLTAAPATAPEAPPTDKLGNPLPDRADLRAVFARDDEVWDWMRRLKKLKGDLKKFVQGKERDPLWKHFDPSAAIDKLAHAHDEFARIRPHAVCPYCAGGKRGSMDKCGKCFGNGWLNKARYATVLKEFKAQ